MTFKQAKRKTIQHWNRMIKWVNKLKNKKVKPHHYTMFDVIGEDWFADSCTLCFYAYEKFRTTENWPISKCDLCSLGKKYGTCSDPGTKNAWISVQKSKTWKGWLYHANRLIKQIESLEE